MSNKLFGTVLLVGAMSVGCVEYGPEPQTVAQQAPEQAPTEQQMYETLAPYGDWVETDVYGSVWCPSAGVVGVGFSPYRHGAWVYGSSGYYFNSYDSWGWLPYHYGNWVSLDVCGWGWVPGFAWGPGWVDWYWGYPYPIAPYWYGYNRPWTIARPTTNVPTPRTIGAPGPTRRMPVSAHTSRVTVPAGKSKYSVGRLAVHDFIVSVQIGSAATAPVMAWPSGRFTSKPTHTPHTRLGTKPTNHASE